MAKIIIATLSALLANIITFTLKNAVVAFGLAQLVLLAPVLVAQHAE